MNKDRIEILKRALKALKMQAEVVRKSYPDIPERLPDRVEIVEAQKELKAVGPVAQEVIKCAYSLNIPVPSLSEERMLAWFGPAEIRY